MACLCRAGGLGAYLVHEPGEIGFGAAQLVFATPVAWSLLKCRRDRSYFRSEGNRLAHRAR
jgi:hypothetical protein